MSYLTHLECPICKERFPSDEVQSFCHPCQSPIIASYDIPSAKQQLDREELHRRPKGMWRWHELLPVHDLAHLSSLGEGDTPLIEIRQTKPSIGSSNFWVKDESINPTASFKARGLSAAVSKAKELGMTQLAIPTAGNAGSALAAYAARARIKSAAVMPSDTPPAIINECRLYGAEVSIVEGLISDCAEIVSQMTETGEWFSVSTFREPYRLEGKKTMGFEIAEQFNWQLPDRIIYPTGGGTGLVGMWKAFKELIALGWLEDQNLPKMISVQSTGCAPVVEAFESGADHCEFWEGAETIAVGVRVPKSLADRQILEILRESGGTAMAIPDEDIQAAQKELAAQTGIFSSPEGVATFVALDRLYAIGEIHPDERVLIFITASGVKYL